MSKPIEQEESGICPNCNSDNVWMALRLVEADFLREQYECSNCKTKFTENYKIQFLSKQIGWL